MNFGKQGLRLGLDMINRWEEPSNQHENSFSSKSRFVSLLFSKLPFIPILSKVQQIPLGIHPLEGFQNHRIILREGCHNLPYLYSRFSSKLSSYSSWYLRRCEISSGLRKFLPTHLGIFVVVKFPRVSRKILRTHLGISVVVEFPRVSPKFLRTHLGISVVVEFPRVSPRFLRTHLRISVVAKFPRVSPKFLRSPSFMC